MRYGKISVEGNLDVTGSLSSVTGLSGSLTRLSDGTSYLVAGNNVTITSQSNGSVLIAATGGGGGGGDSFFSSTTNGSVFTTGSVAFRGGESSVDSPSDKGSDVFFFVSGSISGSGVDDKKAVFGGDVRVSGSLSQGGLTIASGIISHAEGSGTTASGAASHAEGNFSVASGDYSHAEGDSTGAVGYASHAEGGATSALGLASHSEGGSTVAGCSGYLSNDAGSTTPGLIILDSAYGDVSGEFSGGDYILLEDWFYGGVYSFAAFEISSVTFNSPNTEITLVDNTVSTFSSAIIGKRGTAIPSGADNRMGYYSHSEGEFTLAQAVRSHAEGTSTKAFGNSSHAEGNNTTASGNYSHAEGNNTTASGNYSHAEGNGTIANAEGAHAEGFGTKVRGNYSHTEGYNSRASGSFCHAEGAGTKAGVAYYYVSDVSPDVTPGQSLIQIDASYIDVSSYLVSPAHILWDEGMVYVSIHVGTSYDGLNTYVTASISRNDTGETVTAIDASAGTLKIAGGPTNPINDVNSDSTLSAHAEGEFSTAWGDGSHAEGSGNAFGDYSHAEGESATTYASYSHAEGSYTSTHASGSHAEGEHTRTYGYFSHAEGSGSITVGSYSHAEGLGTISSGTYQHVGGKYNTRGNDFSLFVIGDGTGDEDLNRGDIIRINPGNVKGQGSLQLTGSLYVSGTSTFDSQGRSVSQIGNDVFFYVSGSVGGTGANDRKSLFGGDVRISGSLLVGAGSSTVMNVGSGSFSITATPTIPTGIVYTENFDTTSVGSLPTGWTTDGNANWAVSATDFFTSPNSAKAGTISNSQSTNLRYDVTSSYSGIYSFAWKVSSETNYDYLTFFIDNITQHSISGPFQGWQLVSGTLSPGAHQLRWTYSKDSSGAHGSDTAFVDNFKYVNVPQTSIATITTGSSTSIPANFRINVNVIHGNESDSNIACGIGSYAGPGQANLASGSYSHAEGANGTSEGTYSHAEGAATLARGIGSHSEGLYTRALGNYSHAEGLNTISFGQNSHSEGYTTVALGVGSHAEGMLTIASGTNSHAEGSGSIARGNYSHAEGIGALASGQGSHAEGGFNTASNTYSHAEGFGSTASALYSHAEGTSTLASATGGHSEGLSSTASGQYAHAEGSGSIAAGNYSHAEGVLTNAGSIGTHAEGFTTTTTSANYSHAEGSNTLINLSYYSHTEGRNTTVYFNDYSHAEGEYTYAYAQGSHAEGYGTLTRGTNSHVEGYFTTSSVGSLYSHAEGEGSITVGRSSHAEGLYTIASGSYQHVGGKYNVRGNNFSLFVIGDGTGDANANRSDIIRVNSGSTPGFGQLQVTGSISVSGSYLLNVVSGTSNPTYNVGSWEHVVVFTTNNVTGVLPASAPVGAQIIFKEGTGLATVSGSQMLSSSAGRIDGSATFTMPSINYTSVAAIKIKTSPEQWIIV